MSLDLSRLYLSVEHLCKVDYFQFMAARESPATAKKKLDASHPFPL